MDRSDLWEERQNGRSMKQSAFYEEFGAFYYYHGSTKNWNMKRYHFHKDYEILLFMGEGGELSIGNRVYQAERGDLFLINNLECHKTSGQEGKEYTRYVLMFDPDFVKRAEVAFGYHFTRYFSDRPRNFIHKISLSGENLDRLIEYFQRFEHGKREKQEEQVTVELVVLEMLVYINQLYEFFSWKKKEIVGWQEAKQEHVEEGREDRSRIEQIKRYVQEHVGDSLTLENIAQMFYMNSYYLSHYFKKETSFTITQYIANTKIAAAKEMLKNGMSVTDTAVALSYSSDSYFIKTFKRLTGTTPKQYVREKSGLRKEAWDENMDRN